MANITDFTINGKCSNCGACCSDTPCVTKEETRRIAKWLASNEVKPFPVVKGGTVLRANCPFRDDVNKRCLIYPVRPLVCRTFKCNMGNKGAEKNLKRMFDRKGASFQISFHWIFMGDPSICEVMGLPLVDRAEWLGKEKI